MDNNTVVATAAPSHSRESTRPRLITEADVDPFAPNWAGLNYPQPAALKILPHPAFSRLMKRLPENLRESFTIEQLRALSLASVPMNSPHVLDYRVSIPIFGRRVYITILAGRERRSLKRLAAEGQLPISKMWQLNATVIAAMALLGIVGLFIAIYIVKSALGVNMFEGDSSMHDVFKALNEQQNF